VKYIKLYEDVNDSIVNQIDDCLCYANIGERNIRKCLMGPVRDVRCIPCPTKDGKNVDVYDFYLKRSEIDERKMRQFRDRLNSRGLHYFVFHQGNSMNFFIFQEKYWNNIDLPKLREKQSQHGMAKMTSELDSIYIQLHKWN
jgi:hypothetical protein